MRGHRPLSPVTLTSADVLSEDVAGRAMQRHKPSLAELGAADGSTPLSEIHILKLKVAGLAETQPGDTQEPDRQ